MTHVKVTVDRTRCEDEAQPRLLPAHYRCERLGPTGTPIGCGTSNRGADGA
ncbi:hypothetical protein AB0D74_33820 [Streptomyces sp. NPDC048278]|uniref:hypothetical protein n=1 Tax=unclassified Streptomyces TaxID=2593676 RepID=UPI00341DDBBF